MFRCNIRVTMEEELCSYKIWPSDIQNTFSWLCTFLVVH